jgi:hypothetical protein
VDTPKAITLLATDVDGDPLTYQIAAQPAHGTLSGTPPNVTYTPAAGYSGSDSFTFKANDGRVDSNIATVSITFAINCGQDLSGSISAAGQRNSYTFTASANDVVTIRARNTSPYSNYLTLYLELYGPTGALVGSASSGTLAQLDKTLTETGTYTVVVRDDNYVETGTYTLNWQKPGCP